MSTLEDLKSIDFSNNPYLKALLRCANEKEQEQGYADDESTDFVQAKLAEYGFKTLAEVRETYISLSEEVAQQSSQERKAFTHVATPQQIAYANAPEIGDLMSLTPEEGYYTGKGNYISDAEMQTSNDYRRYRLVPEYMRKELPPHDPLVEPNTHEDSRATIMRAQMLSPARYQQRYPTADEELQRIKVESNPKFVLGSSPS